LKPPTSQKQFSFSEERIEEVDPAVLTPKDSWVFVNQTKYPLCATKLLPLPSVTEVASSGAGREANHLIFEDG